MFGALGMTFLPTTLAGDWGGLLGLYALQWLYSVAGMMFAFLMIWLLRNVALGIVSVFFFARAARGPLHRLRHRRRLSTLKPPQRAVSSFAAAEHAWKNCPAIFSPPTSTHPRANP